MRINTYIKDRRGKEIYLGDIVRYRPYITKEYIGKVAFNEAISSYVIVNNSNEVIALLSKYNDLEVISK